MPNIQHHHMAKHMAHILMYSMECLSKLLTPQTVKSDPHDLYLITLLLALCASRLAVPAHPPDRKHLSWPGQLALLTAPEPGHFQHLTELAPSDVPMNPSKSSIVTFPLFFTKSLNTIYCRAIIFTSGGTFAFQNNHRII